MMVFYFYLVCFTFSISYSVLPFHLAYVFQFLQLFFSLDVLLIFIKHSRTVFVYIYINNMYIIYIFQKRWFFAKLKYLIPFDGLSMNSVETSSTSRVSESTIWQENEKRDTRIQSEARIRGPTPLQGEGAETESKPALLYFQPWMKE